MQLEPRSSTSALIVQLNGTENRRIVIRKRDHFISLEMASVRMKMMAAWGDPSIGARLAGEPKVNPTLLEPDNVTMCPHVGSASMHTREAMGQLVVDNLVAFTHGKPPKTPVPETPFKGW